MAIHLVPGTVTYKSTIGVKISKNLVDWNRNQNTLTDFKQTTECQVP